MAPATAASSPSSPGQRNTSSSLPSEPFPFLDKFITGLGSIHHSPWLPDLELMHHYTSSTFLTLPRAADLHHIWQIEVPKLAISHTFLLHQVLALSAQHQSHLHLDRYSHYSIYASVHQNRAIAGLRTALTSIDYNTCHEIFIVSSLLSISAFATFSNFGGVCERPRMDDLLNVFQLVRGMSRILDSFTALLQQGTLGKLFLKEETSRPAPLLTAIVEELRQIDIPETIHLADASVCRESIAGVISWVEAAILTTSTPDLRVCLSFAMCLTEEFIDLIQQRHPVALLIVTYYCVILHFTGQDHWYLRGWGRSIMDDIAVNIEPGWHNKMKWPMRIVENGSI